MSVIENKKPSTIVEGFSHIIALIPSNTKPIINPQTAPFTRIHCKSLPTLFSIISINVLSSNLSRFSCTSFPIFEWLFSTSFTTCFVTNLLFLNSHFVIFYFIHLFCKNGITYLSANSSLFTKATAFAALVPTSL